MAGTAWKRQKDLQEKYSTEEGKVPDHNAIVSFISAIEDRRDAALLALMYLTGGRVSEIVKSIKRGDFRLGTKANMEVLTITMPNEKSKKVTSKTLPVIISQDKPLVDIIMGYANSFQEDIPIFNITRQRAWQITTKYGYNPHFMRHMRLTHLVTMYEFNERLLIRFAGWTDSRPASHYMELNVGDLVDKMKLRG